MFKCGEFILSSFIKNNEQYEQKKLKNNTQWIPSSKLFYILFRQIESKSLQPIFGSTHPQNGYEKKFVNMIVDMLDYVVWQIIRF